MEEGLSDQIPGDFVGEEFAGAGEDEVACGGGGVSGVDDGCDTGGGVWEDGEAF